MNPIKTFFIRHPTRAKYLLLVGDILLLLIATKMVVNFSNIQETIQSTQENSKQKNLEVEYTRNFLLPYEKSDYANFFLRHENNILGNNEIIIRFQKKEVISEKTGTDEKTIHTGIQEQTPQQSRKQFFQEKILHSTTN